HPVKSMGGESIRETAIERRFGVVGDRAWAIRDLVAGEIRGAKKIPALMMLGARYLEPPAGEASAPIEIDLGGGRRVRSDDAAVSERLSERLGMPVELCSRPPAHEKAHYRRARPITDPETEIREAYELLPDEPTPKLMEGPVDFSLVTEYVSPPGTYFDFFDLHLLSTRSLERFAALVPDSVVEARRFRPNLVVELEAPPRAGGGETPPGEADWPELAWLGRTFSIGAAAFEITLPMTRCGMTTHAQAGLPKDPRIMRALYRECSLNLGVAVTVLRAGRVRVGDAIRLAEA
ncbi:MOSC domain-containing protein, partial [Myxococcota bacterium]|nr:MOSC domain-containing protein [Myxococcota bacterium]